MPRSRRLGLALAIGVVWFCVALMLIRATPPFFVAGDFTFPWRAARLLVQHHDPYQVIQPTGHYPFDERLYLPLPAALVMLPFAPIAPQLGSALFTSISATILAYALLTRSPYRLPMLVSLSAVWAAQTGQWSPLLSAAYLLPGLAFLAAAKPNLGLAAFAAHPTRRAFLAGVVLVGISLAILPRWPFEWLDALRATSYYRAPLAYVGGPLLLFAALRWRRPEARLLLVLSCVPQSMFFYDQLPLFLVAETLTQSLILLALNYATGVVIAVMPPFATKAAYLAASGQACVALLYLPALFLILRRPNIGEVPGVEVLQRIARRRPARAETA